MRTNTTYEVLDASFTLHPRMGDLAEGLHILSGRKQTKWMTKQSSADYLAAIDLQVPAVIAEMVRDPHSRRLVIHGPHGACWISTQLLSDQYQVGYHLIANYRSMDIEHARADAAIQAAIANKITGHLLSLSFNIGSFHQYKDPTQ